MKQLDKLSQLWIEAIQDDELAYGKLHKLLYPCLYSYVLNLLKDGDIADDLLQELFAKLWGQRKHLSAINNIKAYFFAASRSMAINHFRKMETQRNRLLNNNLPGFTFSPEDILISSEEDIELKNKMAEALSLLPSRQREMVYLRFYQNLDYNKIAEITGIRYQSVINHVFRALETLRYEFCGIKTEKYLLNVA